MSLNPATIKRIAALARIRVDESGIERLSGELGAILAFVEQLDAVDVEGIEPMTGPVAATLRLRPDIVTEPDRRDAVLGNATDPVRGFFTVPKVVE